MHHGARKEQPAGRTMHLPHRAAKNMLRFSSWNPIRVCFSLMQGRGNPRKSAVLRIAGVAFRAEQAPQPSCQSLLNIQKHIP